MFGQQKGKGGTPVRTLTVRLPERLAADIEAEATRRRIPRSRVVRERLKRGALPKPPRRAVSLEAIADLIGSVDGDLPSDLSANAKG
jgi:hypothetical protein